MALTHIDTDGDGIITRAEVKDASTGAVVVRQSAMLFPAFFGCAGGVLFYVLFRWIMRKRHAKLPPHQLHARHCSGADVPLQPRLERRKRVG